MDRTITDPIDMDLTQSLSGGLSFNESLNLENFNSDQSSDFNNHNLDYHETDIVKKLLNDLIDRVESINSTENQSRNSNEKSFSFQEQYRSSIKVISVQKVHSNVTTTNNLQQFQTIVQKTSTCVETSIHNYVIDFSGNEYNFDVFDSRNNRSLSPVLERKPKLATKPRNPKICLHNPPNPNQSYFETSINPEFDENAVESQNIGSNLDERSSQNDEDQSIELFTSEEFMEAENYSVQSIQLNKPIDQSDKNSSLMSVYVLNESNDELFTSEINPIKKENPIGGKDDFSAVVIKHFKEPMKKPQKIRGNTKLPFVDIENQTINIFGKNKTQELTNIFNENRNTREMNLDESFLRNSSNQYFSPNSPTDEEKKFQEKFFSKGKLRLGLSRRIKPKRPLHKKKI